MLDGVPQIIALVLSALALWSMYDFIENDAENIKSTPGKVRGIFIRSSVYEVVKVKNISNYYNKEFGLVVSEDGVKIPVDCSKKVATKIEEILSLNRGGAKISIKAKIDRKRLKLISLKGYIAKQQED